MNGCLLRSGRVLSEKTVFGRGLWNSGTWGFSVCHRATVFGRAVLLGRQVCDDVASERTSEE